MLSSYAFNMTFLQTIESKLIYAKNGKLNISKSIKTTSKIKRFFAFIYSIAYFYRTITRRIPAIFEVYDLISLYDLEGRISFFASFCILAIKDIKDMQISKEGS